MFVNYIIPKVLNILVYVTVTQDKVAYIEMANGGHLGFYEGGLIYPNPISWLEKSLVSIVGALVCAHMEKKTQ